MDHRSTKGQSNDQTDGLVEIFDERKLSQAIKKGKQKSLRKTIFVSLLVAVLMFILLNIGNMTLTTMMGNKANQRMSAYIELTVPNGYISTSIDNIGFLGGRSDYTISRIINNKPVILENRMYPFGILPQITMSRHQGGAGHIAGEWPTSYWDYGYGKMMFFHPEITYKEYKNDLAELNQIANDKVIELGLSLDKSYTIAEVSELLPDLNISWYWINAFKAEDIDRYKQNAIKYDAKATYIPEYETLGVSMRAITKAEYFPFEYNDFLFNLKISQNPRFLEIYNDLDANGYIDPAKVPILGVIVYGTKDQLASLTENPHIKASSFGVIVDKYGM